MSKLPQRATAGLALAIALIAINTTVKWVKAEISYIKPHTLIADWQASGGPTDSDPWAEVRDATRKPLALNPYKPEYSVLMGDVYYWRAVQQRMFPDQSKENTNIAIRYYKNALIARPTWAQAWLKIVDAKLVAAYKLDAMTERALNLAATYGKFESDIQQAVIYNAFKYWDGLTTGTKSKITDMLYVAIARHSNKLPKFIRAYSEQFDKQSIVQRVMSKIQTTRID